MPGCRAHRARRHRANGVVPAAAAVFPIGKVAARRSNGVVRVVSAAGSSAATPPFTVVGELVRTVARNPERVAAPDVVAGVLGGVLSELAGSAGCSVGGAGAGSGDGAGAGGGFALTGVVGETGAACVGVEAFGGVCTRAGWWCRARAAAAARRARSRRRNAARLSRALVAAAATRAATFCVDAVATAAVVAGAGAGVEGGVVDGTVGTAPGDAETAGTETGGTRTAGVVTAGVVTTGVVTGGTVTDGTVTAGVVTAGVEGTVTAGTAFETALVTVPTTSSASAVGAPTSNVVPIAIATAATLMCRR